MKKIVIVGGGTAGWFAAAKLKKEHPNIDITLIESPSIPIIGVGESVTQHVVMFLKSLGIDEHKWMRTTGAIYKFSNKFINWAGNNDYHYFGFNFPTDVKLLKHDHAIARDVREWKFNQDTVRTTDTLMQILAEKKLPRFDQYFHGAFHYMERNTIPFEGKTDYLLNTDYSWSHHINAELSGQFVRDSVALPHGVIHIVGTIVDVGVDNQQCITHLKLDNDTEVTADLYIDATGFHRVLTDKLDWKFKKFEFNPIDRAWVCQTDYSDPKTEMVNYTQSIAEPHGWRFKIGLFHRMGNGYCFSSDHVSDQDALDHLDQQIKLKKGTPRLLKWTPGRLQQLAHGNTVAIGLSCGFTEPLEANALFSIVSSIELLSHTISTSPPDTQRLDFSNYNSTVTHAIDDIAEFILVHYTLSQRTDTDFWNYMRDIGKRERHQELVYEKYNNKFNSITSAFEGYTLFPEYMWAHLAHGWGLDLSPWQQQELSQLDLDLTYIHHTYRERKNYLISQHCENNYEWLKNNIFNRFFVSGKMMQIN